MNLNNWKPYYMKKGNYPDGRNKILIAWYEEGQKKKTYSLPKPEELLKILEERYNRSRISIDFKGNVKERQNQALRGS